jgi:hypothetical protein
MRGIVIQSGLSAALVAATLTIAALLAGYIPRAAPPR